MKIDRLISIVVYLLNHGRTSAQKLAEEFEVSSRTIMRDLESLNQAGINFKIFLRHRRRLPDYGQLCFRKTGCNKSRI